MSEDTRRTLAADDFDAIRQRMQELRGTMAPIESSMVLCDRIFHGKTCPVYCMKVGIGEKPICTNFGGKPVLPGGSFG